MIESNKLNVAIVDYGVGNLFSVKHACNSVGMQASITFDKQEILSADAVILPGVGAFGNAIESLEKLDLVYVLKDIATSSKPFVGICLGMHLLMDESEEFGGHQGLGIIKGSVIRLDNPVSISGKRLKVPHVGWNRIYKKSDSIGDLWTHSVLEGLANGEFMYFVHSYYSIPENDEVVFSTTNYQGIEYCSSISRKNVFAFQFHPEKSGVEGLKIYRNWATMIRG